MTYFLTDMITLTNWYDAPLTDWHNDSQNYWYNVSLTDTLTHSLMNALTNLLASVLTKQLGYSLIYPRTTSGNQSIVESLNQPINKSVKHTNIRLRQTYTWLGKLYLCFQSSTSGLAMFVLTLLSIWLLQ